MQVLTKIKNPTIVYQCPTHLELTICVYVPVDAVEKIDICNHSRNGYLNIDKGALHTGTKTDLRNPDLRSGSMWSRVRFDTAGTEQSCQFRIKAPACPCRGRVVYWDPRRIRILERPIVGSIWSRKCPD